MAHKIITILSICSVIALQGHNDLCTNELVSRNLAIISEHTPDLGNNFKIFLDKVQENDSKLATLLASDRIKEIFNLDLSSFDVSILNSMQTMQYLILLSLCQKMFEHHTIACESFLNVVLTAKKYWMYEDFYMKQSFFGKNIVYNFYSSKYQNKITTKLQALDAIENDVAGIFGFCLYGLSNIQKIKSEDVLVEQINMIFDQFGKLFNISDLNHEQKRDPIILFNQIISMNDTIQQRMNIAQVSIKQNDKASFLVDHWFGISCATVAAITAACMYAKHEQTITSIYQQGKIAVPNFWQEYIVDPMIGLKEVVWDQKTKKLEHVQHFPDILEFPNIPESQDIPEFDGYMTYLVNPILNPLVKVINTTKKDLIKTANTWKDDIVKTANTWKEASENTLNTKIDEANNTIIKNNQINMYLATIVPVLLGSYVLYSSTFKAYDHYVKHKNWYLPMRYIIRSIDQLVNKVARSCQEHSFMDDGKLYMLVQQLKGYIVCLSNEELFLMNSDINELLSFDLNYGQKKGVIDRMYKTYEFLK